MDQKTIICHSVSPIKRSGNDNTVEEILASTGPISYDGIYLSIYENRKLLRPRLKGAILFFMGNYVGKDNSFDEGMPRERYCDWNQLMELVIDYGCVIGWHTWSHPNLTMLPQEDLEREVTPPFPMDYFAYPYSAFTPRVEEAVKKAGFIEAFCASPFGDDSRYQRKRRYL